MKRKKTEKPASQPGRPPERLKINGTFEAAVRKALKKKRPADGWPNKPDVKKQG